MILLVILKMQLPSISTFPKLMLQIQYFRCHGHDIQSRVSDTLLGEVGLFEIWHFSHFCKFWSHCGLQGCSVAIGHESHPTVLSSHTSIHRPASRMIYQMKIPWGNLSFCRYTVNWQWERTCCVPSAWGWLGPWIQLDSTTSPNPRLPCSRQPTSC